MPKQSISTGSALRFLLSYMKKFRVSIAAGIVLLMIVDTFQLVIPRIVKRIIDTLGEQHFSQELVMRYALAIAGLAAAMTLIRFFYRLLIFLPSRKIETAIRDDLFTHLTRLSFSFFNAVKTGDLLALFTNDLNAVRMATGMALIGMTVSIRTSGAGAEGPPLALLVVMLALSAAALGGMLRRLRRAGAVS